MKMNEIALVVPVYNPEPGLKGLCEALLPRFGRVIVVDDGSDEHIEDFAALPAGVTLLRHEVNRGKGRAIKTAFEWLVANAPEVQGAVFADGDGQHRPEDVVRVAARMLETGRATLGVRDFTRAAIPFRSRFGNVCTSFLVRLLFRLKIYDTQTGLRAIPSKLFAAMIATPGERYEYEMRLFGLLRDHREPLEQIPIETIYIDSNRASHFRPFIDSVIIYRSLFAAAMWRRSGG